MQKSAPTGNGKSSFLDPVRRLAVILGVVFLIAAIHIFRLGSYLPGSSYDLYYSYFSDLILPFGAYFLLCMLEVQMPVLQGWEPLLPPPKFLSKNKGGLALTFFGPWQVKFAIAFLIPSIAETCQYFGIPVLGSTFDPIDFLMYACGALLAAGVETQVFVRVFGFWARTKAGG